MASTPDFLQPVHDYFDAREKDAYAKGHAAGVAETEAKYKAALEEIKRDQGRVCDGFELCQHESCRSSYTSWAIADKVLRQLGEEKP